MKRGLEGQLSPGHRWASSLCPLLGSTSFPLRTWVQSQTESPRVGPGSVCRDCSPELWQGLVCSEQRKTCMSSGGTHKGWCQWSPPRAPAI